MTTLAAPSTLDDYRHPPPAPALVAAGRAELAAGGGPSLAQCYEICRRLNAVHGRTYYFATQLLPAPRRPHVHALYAFARYADDLVDHLGIVGGTDQRREALEAWSRGALEAIARGDSDEPVLRATAHTVATFGISRHEIEAFLTSMAMDLTVTRYATFTDLSEYMHGSAAVIGTMMVPVLGGPPKARIPAMDLGIAFQLTNFLRDVAEDWDRGRIYLPLEDLDRFGVTEWDFRVRRVGPAFRRLLAFEVGRTRALYRRAEAGWALLPPASARCIRIAHRLYAGILDRIEAGDYQVFRARAKVVRSRKLAVAAQEVFRARSAAQGPRDLPSPVRETGRRGGEVQA